MPMSYEDRAAPTGAMRRSETGPALSLARQGRQVRQGPANFSGARARPGYQAQPADRPFARGNQTTPPVRQQAPAPAAQPTPGATAPTGPVTRQDPVTIKGKFGNIAAGQNTTGYKGMMGAGLQQRSLKDALAPANQSTLNNIAADPNALANNGGLTRWEGGSRNRDNTVQVLDNQNGGYNASVLGGGGSNLSAGGAGTAQGQIQGAIADQSGTLGVSDQQGDGQPAYSQPDWLRRTGAVSEGSNRDMAPDDTPPDLRAIVADATNGAGGGGSGNPIMDALMSMLDQAGTGLSTATDKMNTNDMGQIDEHFGESAGAYRAIMDMARGASDPAEQQRVEDAARGDLYSGINNQRDAAQRQMLASSGRGGYQSSGAQTGIYNAAMQAAQAGERGLTQDAFGRRQAATQLGMTGLGAGASALENLKQSGFTSNKELMSWLLKAIGGGKELFDPTASVNL